MKVGKLFGKYMSEYLEHNAINPERAMFAWKNLKLVFHSMDAEKLLAGSVARYQASRQAASSTVNRELGVLAAALRWGANQGYISTVPHISKMRSPGPRQRVLDEAEIASLLEAAKPWPHVALFIKLALLTGQRKEAILSLKWEQIRDDIIDFKPHNFRMANRRKGRAVLPISQELSSILEKVRAEQRRHTSQARTPWVICCGCGYRYRSFRQAWAKVVGAAGLRGTGVTPHTLRHTAATRLIHQGGSLTETARFLGHSSVKTTEQTYIKWSPAYLKNAVELVTLNG